MGNNLQRFEIKIWLVKAIKEHQTVCTHLDKTSGHRWQRGEKGTELDGNGNAYRCSYILDQTDIILFQFYTGKLRISRQVVDVQFQGVSTCLLYLVGILYPSTG